MPFVRQMDSMYEPKTVKLMSQKFSNSKPAQNALKPEERKKKKDAFDVEEVRFVNKFWTIFLGSWWNAEESKITN